MVETPRDPNSPKKPDDTAWIPPKLRGKMYPEDEEPKGSNAANIIAIVMLVGIVILGGTLFASMKKGQQEAKTKAAETAKQAAAQAHADSINKVYEDSLFAARQDSIAKATPKKPPTTPGGTTTPGGATTEPVAATPAAPASKFGIIVGTYLNQERANAEQGKLKSSTGLPVKVQPVTEDGVTSYQVVVGEFTSRAEADKKATDLIVSQGAREAKVIKLRSGG